MPGASPARRLAAWGVHLLTASGAFFGFLALLAIEAGEIPRAFLWLALALAVDGVDGVLARWVRLGEVTPRFDGAIVDVMVDYFTYVILPVLILQRAELLPEGFRLLGAALILISSVYAFGNREAKSPDGFFRGFPALWNLVVFYLYVLAAGPWVCLAVVLLFVASTPVPLKYVHPLRVEELRWANVLASVLLTVSAGVILWQLPERSPWPIALSLAAVAYLGGLGILRTFVPRPTGGESRRQAGQFTR